MPQKQAPSLPQVSTIIATMATAQRADEIRRAVASVRTSSVQPVKLIVVVNGQKFADTVCNWLKQQPDIEFVYSAIASLPEALAIGRRRVATPYFSTLDDDDEFLPGATDLKLQAFHDRPEAALVITNGFNHDGHVDRPTYKDLCRVSASPLHALFEFTWLHNCNALYRSDAVAPSYFDGGQPFAEWTWLAYRLALDRVPIAVLDVPTFRYHDTPQSLSKSSAYLDHQLPLLERMLAIANDEQCRRLILTRMSAVHHHHSVRALRAHQYRRALSSHVRSLALPGGLKYLSYSRRLLPLYPHSKERG